MAEVAKMHHTVPKFYLRGFATSAERITTVRLRGDKSYTQVIDKTAATNHAFDVCYYPCLDATRGRPFGLYIHGNQGTEGAERGIEAITTGLAWVKAAETVVVSGKLAKADLESC